MARSTGDHAQCEYCKGSIEPNTILSFSEAPYYELAGIFAFLGDKEKAIQHLYSLEDSNFRGDVLLFIGFDPLFESLRGDEEFKAIIQRQEKKYAEIRAEVERLSD